MPRLLPKFRNDLAVREIRVGVKEFRCIGVSPPQDHPHIYLNMGENRSMDCPYCSTLFVLDSALCAFETAPKGCYFPDDESEGVR
jgi:uncharacterized Zn-finger protein